MRHIRPFLLLLALVIVLAALLAGLAFLPAVQTQIAQRALDRHPGLHARLGSVAAGTGALEARDLSLEINGTTLTLPTLQAELPMPAALWDRKINVRRLVAKGWTLDLGNTPAAKPQPARGAAPSASSSAPAAITETSAPALAALHAASLFHQLVAGWTLPRDVSLEEVDLEGDVLLPSPRGIDPIAVHLTLKGGGLSPGRDGAFAIEAAFPVVDAAGHLFAMLGTRGRLAVGLDAGGAPRHLELATDLSSTKGHALPENLSASVTLTTADGAHDETYAVGLNLGARHAAAVTAHFPQTQRQLVGTWQIDLRDSDFARFFPKLALPAAATAGSGAFETDDAFTRLRATGQLRTGASHLEVLAAPLARLGTVTLATDFDATHTAQTLRFDRLAVTLGGAGPAIALRALQPFTLDETTADLRPADPSADWLDGSLPGLPLAWIFGSTDGFALAGADVAGEFLVRAEGGKIFLRTKAPLAAPGVTVRHGEKILARGVDLTLPLTMELVGDAWHATAAPLTISSAGRSIGTIDATASSAGGQPIKVVGKWNADLSALAAQPALLAVSGGAGRSASGEFSALTGAWFNVENKFTLVGRDPTHTLTGSLHLHAEGGGRVTFLAPVKIAVGPRASEITAEGSWTSAADASRTVVNLTGDNVTLAHLALLAAPFGAPPPPTAETPDRVPFWGGWSARVSFDFGHLHALGHTFADAGGTFFIDHGAIKLEGGRGVFHQDRHLRVEGSVAFDPAAAVPYAAQAAATVEDIDAALLLGPPARGHEPLLRGHLAVAASLRGTGVNLPDLTRRTQEEFRVSAVAGSTRLLQTSVAASLAETPTPVKDALGTVGGAFGALLGSKEKFAGSGKNTLAKNTEAILNFTYKTEEIRYDRVAFTAIRAADGSLRLTDIELSAPEERVTGSGRLDPGSGQTFAAWPLSLDLQLGFRGRAAELLAAADALSAKKDPQGYTLIAQPVHFGGTPAQIDPAAWRDFLVKAAAPRPPEPKRKSD